MTCLVGLLVVFSVPEYSGVGCPMFVLSRPPLRGLTPTLVNLAKAAAPAKGKAAGGGGSKKKELFKVKPERDTDVMHSLAITKAGQWSDGWKLEPDECYPDWLWTLLEPEPNLEELRETMSNTPFDELGDLPKETLARFVKLANRERIKANNTRSAKK